VKRLEALGLAIARENNALDPGSEAFQTLNPGLLRSHSVVERVEATNTNGIRILDTFQAGWQALLNNLQAKCNGRTRAKGYDGKLTPDSSLSDLVKTFRYLNVRHVVDFLQDALDDRAITEQTKLNFFTFEEGANGNGSAEHS
jgi:hypothetical protein